MKTTITAAIAVTGCAVVWTAGAAQPVERAMQQLRLPGSAAGGDDNSTVGLLGNYPRSRDASGTSWQPDSTASEDRLESSASGSDTALHGFVRSALRQNDGVSVSRSRVGAGTVGLPSVASLDPFLTAAAYYTLRPELSWRNSLQPDGAIVRGERLQAIAASYSVPLSSVGSVFGYVGTPGEPALGPPVSYMRRLFGIDTPDAGGASHWLDLAGANSRVFTLGYTWRRLKVEGSAFSGRGQDSQRQSQVDLSRLDSKSTRLSYNPSPNWSLQLSRGTLSGLDQLEPNEDIRRTTVSATYNRALHDGNWQTTLAWGRNARKSRESVMGYLLESTLHFNGTHAVFGRLEQVGNGERGRENDPAQGQVYKLNRFTVGYFHNISPAGPIKYDVGAVANRYFVPSSPGYANEPASLMLFVRLKFR